jgi:outer membrane protein assembly factor BamE (lipoprotein component of BamABCDE complex)
MKKALAFLTFCALIGCTSSAPNLPSANSQKSNLTPGMVKASVKEGATNQTDVLQIFGAPNIVTMDTNGNEVWTYDVQSTAYTAAQTSSAGGAGLGVGAGGKTNSAIVGGGIAGGGGRSKDTNVGQSTSSTFTLMITFRDDGVVDAYRMMSTSF